MMARSASFLTWIDSSFSNFSSAARRHALPCSPPKRGRSVAVGGPSTVGVEWCLILKNAAASAYNTDEDDEEGRRQSCEKVMRSDRCHLRLTIASAGQST